MAQTRVTNRERKTFWRLYILKRLDSFVKTEADIAIGHNIADVVELLPQMKVPPGRVPSVLCAREDLREYNWHALNCLFHDFLEEQQDLLKKKHVLQRAIRKAEEDPIYPLSLLNIERHHDKLRAYKDSLLSVEARLNALPNTNGEINAIRRWPLDDELVASQLVERVTDNPFLVKTYPYVLTAKGQRLLDLVDDTGHLLARAISRDKQPSPELNKLVWDKIKAELLGI